MSGSATARGWQATAWLRSRLAALWPSGNGRRLADWLSARRLRRGPATVHLVGAGPGDPELLTLRAWRLLQEADVVLHDRLVSAAVLALLPPHAERREVGRRCRQGGVPQEAVCAQMVALAGQGRRVVRLKGGDPFIFGRGGEEIVHLAASGVPFEVVPGISAAQGCAAAAGIPLTHRDHAHGCQLVTGHLAASASHDWAALARPGQTVVFYMALGRAGEICRQLIAHGLPADYPAAVVANGTTPAQQVLTATLADLPERVEATGIAAPALLIVGETVALRALLATRGTAGASAA